VKFYYGKASLDQHQFLIDQLIKDRQQDLQGKFFYLVPNHIKFAAEVKVLKSLRAAADENGLFAQKDVQVFSFTRLAWYFLKDTPAYNVLRLSKAGLQMLTAAILQDKQDQLTIFKTDQVQIGFVSQLTSQLTELQQDGLAAADTAALAQKAELSVNLKAKLHDLTIVYQEFQRQSKQQFIGNEGILPLLSENLKMRDLSHCYFYIAGFSHLSQPELQLIEVLQKKAATVDLALVADRLSFVQKPNPNALFYRSANLYHRLAAKAPEAKLIPITVTPQNQAKSLLALEDYWISNSRLEFVKPPQLTDQAITLFSAPDRQTEIREVALQIRHLLQQDHGHYRDFVVMTRHLDLYRNIIEPIFQQYDIPFFIDLQHGMSSHPFVELISALFDVADHHYQYHDVMRLLKTELLLPQDEAGQPQAIEKFRDCLDLTENLLLKTGLNGQDWLAKTDWQVYRFTENDAQQVIPDKLKAQTKKVNLIRHFIKDTLPPFFKQIKKAQTGRQAAEILCRFLIDHGVARQLMIWRDQAITASDLAAASKPEEIWNTFSKMIDEYVLIFGERAFDAKLFKDLLLNGFAGAQYSQVPSTLDQVMITETGMAQLPAAQTVFLIGSTSEVMPDQTTGSMLLSDSDRLQLAGLLPLEQKDLEQTSDIQLANENYLAYLAFMLPKKHLILSYPLQTSDGQDLKPSPYLEQIKNYFEIPCSSVASEPAANITLADFAAGFAGTKRSTISQLLNLARNDQNQLPNDFQALADWLNADRQWGSLAQKVFSSLTYQNVPEKLRPQIVVDLYGKTINTSISKLEEFYANPYAYFLKYGLKLQERDVFELSPANTGEFFHAVLDGLHKKLIEQQLELTQLSNAQLQKLIDEISRDLLVLPQFQILSSSNRMQYLSRQLKATINQVAKTIAQQQRLSKSRPFKTEVLFGRIGSQAGLRSLEFKLPHQHLVKVRGKIDRIDLLENKDQTYLGIVDYKSSQHKFSFRDAYYGVSLQMLTYLDALIKNFDLLVPNQKNVQPAGAVYLHLQNPKLDLKDVLKTPFEKAWLKKNKYQGLLLADPSLLELLDTKLVEAKKGTSLIFPIRRKVDGTYTPAANKDPQLITEKQLELLLWHNERLIKQAAQKIFNGELALDPVLWPDRRSALQYSPFKPIMQFDAMLAENNYRRLAKLTGAEVLAKISEERRDSDERKL
jgi:ATP-dependent helicase/nuclease subunit B